MHSYFGFRTKIASCLLLGALLAGCAGNDDGYFPPRDGYYDPPERTSVDVTQKDLRIDLAPGQADISGTQINELNRFLAASGKEYGDHIEIRTSLTRGLGENTSRTARIAGNLRSAFIRGGYLSSRVHLVDTPTSSDGLTVSIQRYQVVLPDCGIEAAKTREDWFNEPVGARPLGCSNERNLGLMIADPRDLVGNPVTGPATGIREAEAVGRYYRGEVKEPVSSGESISLQGD
ncbi:MAG: CpaD family pilus assembly lipoprotein [Alphaproteobacteria bacterium]